MAAPLQISASVSSAWSQWLEPDLRKYTWQVAQEVLAEEVLKGFDTEPLVITDGRSRADPRLVKLYGKIEFLARNDITDVVLWIIEELTRRSPYLGTQPYIYRDSHMVLINGAIVSGQNTKLIGASSLPSGALKSLKPNDKVQIANTVPYARKIEGLAAVRAKINRRTGKKTKGRKRVAGISKEARNGVYRQVFAAAKQRFGRTLFIEYVFMKLPLGVKVWGNVGGGRNRKRVLRDQVYPAIQISQGITKRGGR